MAIILRTGTSAENVVSLASRLLATFRGLPGLARATYAELCAVRGVGAAKAAQIKAALALGRRLNAISAEERPTVQSPQDVANLLQGEMGLLEQEHLRVLLLNTKNQLLGVPEIYQGNVSTAIVRPAEVFRPAVRDNCPAIIVVHNHPSGDPTPSQEDVRLTQELIQAGKLLDIELLDHLVLARRGFVSLKERGLGFS